MCADSSKASVAYPDFSTDESCALSLDQQDPLASFRQQFHQPSGDDGVPKIYFAGNSLGLQPKSVRGELSQELDDWARLGVEAHFDGSNPWFSYHEMLRDGGARLVGAQPNEVVMMNSLTVNLHLMMATFYQPTKSRYKILMDYPAFPSDVYAIKSQLRHHGYDPSDAIIEVRPRDGEHTLRTEDIIEYIERDSQQISLVLLAGVNYFTGQFYDMQAITQAGRKQGCTIGWDLAHAAGNVDVKLHDWDMDFACWCNYKYINSGPGALAGCFVHERHGNNLALPRLAGWWGNDPDKRFQMHMLPEFTPQAGADGWQISNPPIFAAAPVKASLDLFDKATMPALRKKSLALTGYLQFLIDDLSPGRIEVITPRKPESRGCQLSILVHNRPEALLQSLKDGGVVCDFRQPNVIRVAPTPMYNSFHEVWRFAEVLKKHDDSIA